MMNRFQALSLCVLAAAAGMAAAQDLAPAIRSLGASEPMLAVFDAMPVTRLKAVTLRCARESSVRVFSLSEAAPCSMAWDALLKRGFDGDLDGLLAWWRAHRDEVDTH